NMAVVRTIRRSTGVREGMDLAIDLPFTPVDVLISSLFKPGSLLVLDSARMVHEYPLSYRRDGTPYIEQEPMIFGPYGDPDDTATVFAEAPNAADRSAPYLGIGTRMGEVIVVKLGSIDP